MLFACGLHGLGETQSSSGEVNASDRSIEKKRPMTKTITPTIHQLHRVLEAHVEVTDQT